MSEKKKSFQEFLSNDALNPGVKDDKLQKVDVGKRDDDTTVENSSSSSLNSSGFVKQKINKKPVGLFFLLGVVFLGLTIGLSFVSLWALWGIVPTLLCWWKMVLNNGDNNLKSVVYRYDSDYLDRIDSKEKEMLRCQEMEQELEEKKEEEKKKTEAKEKEEDGEKEVKEKQVKKERKGKKSSKTKDDDDELFTYDDGYDGDDEDDDEEEEEEKKSKKAEKSDKKFGSKVEKSGKRDVENDKSRTSLIERNNRIRGQREIY